MKGNHFFTETLIFWSRFGNLSCYSILRKTVEWSKRSCTLSYRLSSLQCIFCLQDLNPELKCEIQKVFASGWEGINTEKLTATGSNSNDAQPQLKEPVPWSPKWGPPGRPLGYFSKHKPGKLVSSNQGKRSIHQDIVGCVL
jgi:hypothetical protein